MVGDTAAVISSSPLEVGHKCMPSRYTSGSSVQWLPQAELSPEYYCRFAECQSQESPILLEHRDPLYSWVTIQVIVDRASNTLYCHFPSLSFDK
jgi:hypothetical protein